MGEKAKSTLLYLHGIDFDADSEIQMINGNTLSNNISWIESIKALKEWKVLKPILILVGIAFLKEFGGHEALVAYSSHILTSQQAIDPKVASLFHPICFIVGAVVCIFIQSYLKIKWLMITASIFQAISHISMAIYYLVSEHYLHCNTEYTQLCHNLAFWPILNISIYAFSFGLGWGIVYFALIGILFTVHREFSHSYFFLLATQCRWLYHFPYVICKLHNCDCLCIFLFGGLIDITSIHIIPILTYSCVVAKFSLSLYSLNN